MKYEDVQILAALKKAANAEPQAWKKVSTLSARQLAAIAEYLGRRDRYWYPSGGYNGSLRWYPSLDERRDCCESIRSPSRRSPKSLLEHCRTLRHCAALYDVQEGDVRNVVKAFEKVLNEAAAALAAMTAPAVITPWAYNEGLERSGAFKALLRYYREAGR